MSDQDMNRRLAQQDHDAARADAAERVRQQLVIADAGMKALLWANGGALVALFTFIGNASGKGKLSLNPGYLWLAFSIFVIGLLSALLTHAFAFLSQDRFYHQSMHELWRAQDDIVSGTRATLRHEELEAADKGQVFYATAFAFAVLSIILFAIGCGFALAGVLIG